MRMFNMATGSPIKETYQNIFVNSSSVEIFYAVVKATGP